MIKIHTLSPEVILRIAAGQVVERPASIVRELIDNALDAGATEIRIELDHGGKTKILVTDNGTGMDIDDLRMSFLHHTTSKIETVADLLSIGTYGFRGEALSSIAAVSKLQIQSKTSTKKNGYEVAVRRGKLLSESPVGIPSGTRVLVEQLFDTIPARKKFLKSDITEFRYCLEAVMGYMLVVDHCSFHVFHNKKRILTFPSGQKRRGRIKSLTGIDVKSECFSIQMKHSGWMCEGFITTPQYSDARQKTQWLFVNGRVSKDASLTRIVREQFARIIATRMNPSFIIYLTVPPDHVDVNIHPRKETVLITGFESILEHLRKMIQTNLSKNDSTYLADLPILRDRSMDDEAALRIRSSVTPWSLKEALGQASVTIFQLHKMYIIAEVDDGCVFIDQHAAHERILFDEFKRGIKQGLLQTKEITKPLLISLNSLEQIVFEECQEALKTLGFDFESYGEGTVRVVAVPILYKGRKIEVVLKELLRDFDEGVVLDGIDSIVDRTLAYLACRTAIKAGDTLSEKEQRRLLDRLVITDNQFTCPHGRPTQIKLSDHQLAQLFRRK